MEERKSSKRIQTILRMEGEHRTVEIVGRFFGFDTSCSLMRNGVIPALFPRVDQEEEVLDATVCHGIITHYQPLTVLTCVVHSLLIRFENSNATERNQTRNTAQ